MKTLLSCMLQGTIALWRNPEDSVGSISCLGPAPSHISGILGAAMGYSSMGFNRPFKATKSTGFEWPVAEQLIAWGKNHHPKVACRLLQMPERFNLDFIGPKTLNLADPHHKTKIASSGRFTQVVLDNPAYELVIQIEDFSVLQQALREPVYRICLGAQSCPGFISNVHITDASDEGNWAKWSPVLTGDATPFTQHLLGQTVQRIRKNGYWNYDTEKETRLSSALKDLYA